MSVTTLGGDKRRLEADLQSMHSDLNEALNARRAADERADRMQMELNRLTDELRQVGRLPATTGQLTVCRTLPADIVSTVAVFVRSVARRLSEKATDI